MKKIIIILNLLIVSLAAIANNTTVNIRFKMLQSNTVEVLLPIGEKTFFLNKKAYTIDADSSIHISLQLNKAVAIRCEGYSFIIEPGTTSIIIDMSKKADAAVTYRGKNEAGQILYRKWHPEFYQHFAEGYLEKDSSIAGIKKLVESDKKKTIRTYDSLLILNAITPLFYNFVKTDVDIYYAAVMAHIPIYLFYKAKRENQPYLSAAYEKLWKETYLQYPVMNAAALTSGNFYDYAQSYSSTYKHFYLLDTTQRKNVEADIKTEGGYLAYLYQCLERDFTGPVKEYMLAYFLGYEMFQRKYQPELKELFNRFVKKYPQSNFTASLQPWADEITRFHAETAKSFTTEQVLIHNYDKINSLDELLSLYKDKTVYVDLWATWCGPCKGEFAYNKELKPQLKNNGVTMLYISMDELKAEEKWKTMIKYYNLAGQHLRANDSLKADLIKKLWKGKGYAIPRYLIIKNGELINKDALRPSDMGKLYAQLQSSI